MNDLEKAKRRSKKMKERMEEALKGLGVSEVNFSSQGIMVSNQEATMRVQIDVSLKFKV